MRTAEDPSGTRVRGTFQNCANGYTPWGTYLSCEENFTAYFVNDSASIPRLQDRYGIPTTKNSWGFRWQEFDERFDAVKHPNEANRFGWVVEFDPYDPTSEPGQAHGDGPHRTRRSGAVDRKGRPRRLLHGRR